MVAGWLVRRFAVGKFARPRGLVRLNKDYHGKYRPENSVNVVILFHNIQLRRKEH